MENVVCSRGYSTSDIRFMYVRDPKCPDRVVTVARGIGNDGYLYVAWCVNRVEDERVSLTTRVGSALVRERSHEVRIYDHFSKSRARAITRGRLVCEHLKAPEHGGEGLLHRENGDQDVHVARIKKDFENRECPKRALHAAITYGDFTVRQVVRRSVAVYAKVDTYA